MRNNTPAKEAKSGNAGHSTKTLPHNAVCCLCSWHTLSSLSALTQYCLTLFTSIRGKNLSTCSLKAVALISPCEHKREHISAALLDPHSEQQEQATLTARWNLWSNSTRLKMPSEGSRHPRSPHTQPHAQTIRVDKNKSSSVS